MFCTNCGSKVEGEFCPKCGQKVGAAPVAAAAAIETKHGPVRRLWNGRIGRLHFFTGSLFGLLPIFVLVSLWGVVQLVSESTNPGASSGGFFNAVLPILVALASFWWIFLHLCVAIRRSHDVGITGWISLLTYIPYLGLIPALYLLFKKGEEGANAYGPAPRERGFLADVFNY